MKSRDQGFGIWMRGFGSLIGAGCLVALGCSLAVARGAERKAENPRIIVRVHDYAGVSRDILNRAEREMAKIFAAVEVETIWVDGPLAGVKPSQCTLSPQAVDLPIIDVNILPGAMAARYALQEAAVAYAPLEKEGDRASLASVFYERVKEVAAQAAMPLPRILAYAMAHELGHLLLRTSRHSWKGIMRAGWTPKDFSLDACGQLLFTPEQAKLIRKEVRERAQEQAAEKAATVIASK